MKTILLLFLIFITSFISNGCNKTREIPLMEKLAITVKDSTREFSFTNKRYGQYYGETNSGFTDGWQGWTLREQRIFNDYDIKFDNTSIVRSNSIAFVYPHLLKRVYNNNVEEQFFFADSLDLINIKFENLTGNKLEFNLVGLNGIAKEIVNDNTIKININNIIPGNNLYVYCSQKINNSDFHGNRLNLSFNKTESLNITLAVAKDLSDIQKYFSDINLLINQKRERIEKLLADCSFKTNDENFDKAMMWAIVSLDALVTKQDMKGIYAGLPWFNNYWGRDTFISLPGIMATGNYEDAKDILLSFAKHQDKNPSSQYFGRIPNRITINETIYNTVDGTPWFIIQAYNYYKYTNDTLFLKEIYPSVKLAYQAALSKHVDQYGFLTHSDQETWMDAVGPDGPWSPRGDRAVDIQALWFNQLNVSHEMALLLNDKSFADKVSVIASDIQNNFRKYFLDSTNYVIYDRLRPDGTPDRSIRPNQFIALNESGLFQSSVDRIKYLSTAMKELVYPYGVVSLSQNDENFHPYHNYPPYYVKDAAYHNGIIWQWNSGPVVKLLCSFGKQEMAWSLTSALTDQILHRGAAGTLAELSDALPRPGEKKVRLSGTFSQAWSLGEYIRSFYQDYLGVKVSAPDNALYLIPTLPSNLNSVEFKQKVGVNIVKVNYIFNEDIYKVLIDGKSVKDSIDVGIGLINKADANYQFRTALYKNDKLVVEVPAHSNHLSDLKVYRNQTQIKVKGVIYNEKPENIRFFDQIKFAVPRLNKNLKSLKGPDYKLLDNHQIKKQNDKAYTIFDITGKEGDEVYQYPTNPNFVEGILDITGFSLKEDSDNYYFTLKFKKLHNPGWHYEYGFQLTYASICLHTAGSPEKTTDVKMNSNYILPANRAFNKIINVGGGFDIRDINNKIFAAYLPKPEDAANPLGNINTGLIEFSIPKEYIGAIDKNSIISILVGAQDDHGGAGIGEFRNVGKTAAEWEGGGKKNPSGSNVFDIMFIN